MVRKVVVFIIFLIFFWNIANSEEDFVTLQTGPEDVRIEDAWVGVDWGITPPSGPPPHHYYRSPEEDARLKSLELPVSGFTGEVVNLEKLFPPTPRLPLILAPPIETGFAGPHFGEIGATWAIPPDPHLAVGPSDVGVVVNVALAFYTQSGSRQLYTSLNSWFGSLASGLYTFDPRIVFDPYANRWVVMYAGANSSARRAYWLIAFSESSNPLGTWCKYRIASQDTNRWIDFPLMGVDAQAVYLTGNMFDWWGTSVRSDLVVIPKNQMEPNCPASLTYFYRADLRVAGNYIASSVHPAIHYGPTSAGYIISENCCFSPYNFLSVWKVENADTSPTITRIDLPTFSYYWPPDAPQQGGSDRISTNDSRISATPIWRNGFLYATHPLNYNWGTGNRSAIVYYQIDTTTWDIVDNRILGDADHWYYYPALTVDENENLGLGFGRSSFTEYASAWYTFKLSTDSTFQSPSTLRSGAGYYNPTGSSSERWGDYYGAAVDPLSRIWFIGEYVRSPNVWGTWVGMLTSATPDITVSPTSVDFGSVVIGQSAFALATVRNEGNGALNINSVSVSGAEFFLDSDACSGRSIPPAGFCQIRLRFSPVSTGVKNGILSISSNDPDESLANIPLSGTGITSASIEANPNPVDFGLILAGTSATQNLTVSNSGETSLDIYDVQLDGEGFSIFDDQCSGANLPPNGSCNIQVQFSPPAPGAYNGEIQIFSSDANRNPLVTALIGSAGLPEITAEPGSLDFGVLRMGNNSERSIRVRNDGSFPLSIGGITLSNEAFSLVSDSCSAQTLSPGEFCWLRIRFSPPAVDFYSGLLSIPSDDQDENPLLISLSGEGGLPDILADPIPLNFGVVRVGEPSLDRQVQVRNEGNLPLLIFDATLNGEGFELVSEGCQRPLRPLAWQVRPQDFCVFVLRFHPDRLGPFSGSLTLSNDDPDENPTIVPLQGVGGLPDILIANTEVDFGIVGVNESAERTVEVMNEGNMELIITGISPPAGAFSLISENCTVEPIAPSASCSININFSPAQEGNFQSGMVISSDDPDEAIGNVRLLGMGAYPAISIQPTMLDFGSVRLAQSASNSVIISNTATASLRITNAWIEGTETGFDILQDACSGNALSKDASCEIIVQFIPTEERAYSARLWVSSNDQQSPHLLSLSGRGVEARIEVLPEQIDFGKLRLGQSAERSILIRSIGSDALQVGNIQVSDSGFTLTVDECSGRILLPNEFCQVMVQFSPTEVQMYSGEVQVPSDATAEPIVVNLSGQGGASEFLITPSDRLIFPQRIVGTSEEQIVQGRVEGDFPLFVEQVEVTGSGFILTSDKCSGFSIPPNGTCSIRIRFTPASVGAHSGQLRFQIQGETSPIILPLEGEGIAGGLSFIKLEVTPPAQPLKKGAMNISALAFALRAGSAENVLISSITLSAGGSGNDASHITDVKFWRDVNKDLVWDSGDVFLGNGKFPGDNGTLQTNLNKQIPGGTEEVWLVTLDFSNQISPSLALAGLGTTSSHSAFPGILLPFFALFAFLWRWGRKMPYLFLLVLFGMMLITLPACGGGGQPPPIIPTTYTYRLQIPAPEDIQASGAVSQLSLPVQVISGTFPYTGPEILLSVP